MSMLPLLVSLFPLGPDAAAAGADLFPLNTTLAPQDAEAAEAEGEDKGWTGSASAGATLTNGTSDTLTVAMTFDAERRVDKNRWTFGAWYNYAKQKSVKADDDTMPTMLIKTDETTADNYGAKLQYDRFVTERLYLLATSKAETDDVQLLQLRASVGGGAGYQFYDEETFSLNGEAGLSGVHEDLEGESPNEYVALRLAYNGTYDWTETTKFTQKAEVLPSLKDSKDWTGKLDTSVDVKMTQTMFLRIQHVLNYDNTPAHGAPIGGDGANKADNRVIVTLGWSF